MSVLWILAVIYVLCWVAVLILVRRAPLWEDPVDEATVREVEEFARWREFAIQDSSPVRTSPTQYGTGHRAGGR